LLRPGERAESLPAPDQISLALQQEFIARRDDAPSALLYLALRAARRAVARDPADAHSYLVLGQCYLHLIRNTRERFWARSIEELPQLRRAQAAAALQQAVSLRPTLAQAHLHLGGLYQEVGSFDLALAHLGTYLRLARKDRALGVTAERRADLEERLGALADEVARREAAWAAEAANLRVFDRATLALRKGLPARALEVLLESDVAAFGAPGMELELELLLQVGRAADVRDWASAEQKEALGPGAYHWLRARALAALGEYAQAQAERAALSRSLTDRPGSEREVGLRELGALLVGQAVLEEQPATGPVPFLLRNAYHRSQFRTRLTALMGQLRQEANFLVFEGLLALEQGRTAQARSAFQAALDTYRDEATAAGGGGLDFPWRVVAQDCARWLK
jgi:tetratricopeptide (TPR) repeat protein